MEALHAYWLQLAIMFQVQVQVHRLRVLQICSLTLELLLALPPVLLVLTRLQVGLSVFQPPLGAIPLQEFLFHALEAHSQAWLEQPHVPTVLLALTAVELGWIFQLVALCVPRAATLHLQPSLTALCVALEDITLQLAPLYVWFALPRAQQENSLKASVPLHLMLYAGFAPW